MLYGINSIRPYHDYVLIRRVDTKKTPSGLYLPQSQEQESNLAQIVSVGPGLPNHAAGKPECKPGEYWLVAKFIGTKINIETTEYILVKWVDCQARVDMDEESKSLLDSALDALAEAGV